MIIESEMALSLSSNERVAVRGGDRLNLAWTFRIDGISVPDWNWTERGRPPLDRLQPTRTPHSSKRHRHILATAYSMRNGGYLQLESGLEHDLLRKIDRDPAVEGIVAQPLILFWHGGEEGHHFPDLLSWKTDGSVTVWDARSVDNQTVKFRHAMAITAAACASVGWRHEVFLGLGRFERVNLLWLHGFRRRPLWGDAIQPQICSVASRVGATLGDLFDCDDGSGELIAMVWHLIWSGVLAINMQAHWERETAIALRQELVSGDGRT